MKLMTIKILVRRVMYADVSGHVQRGTTIASRNWDGHMTFRSMCETLRKIMCGVG